MPKVNLTSPRMRANKNFTVRVKGITHTCDEKISMFVPKAFGMPYPTYVRRMRNVEEFKVSELRIIFDKCGFSNEEILQFFCRKP